MVAYLQDGVLDDDRLAAKTSEKPKPAGLPLTHEAALKWFYKDPQGEIQGEIRRGFICSKCNLNTVYCTKTTPVSPLNLLLSFCALSGPFSNQEMTEWFQAGYFTMSLLVKRGCDEVFQPLGEIMKIWGRVPFTPGPAPPPLQVCVVLLCKCGLFCSFCPNLLCNQHQVPVLSMTCRWCGIPLFSQ